MLAVLLIVSMFSQGLSLNNSGTNFITAFPENIAFYYQKNQNYLKITSLHSDTLVTIKYNGGVDGILSNSTTLANSGMTWTWNLTKEVEEHRFTSSNKSVTIISTKDITVLSVSGWLGRLQSHVVQPIQNLGTVYHIPTLNYTKIVTSFNLLMYSELRYSSFRLFVINAVGSSNTITIKQVDEKGQSSVYTQTLDSYHTFQLQSNGEVTQINGTDKIAVMLTHPCFDSKQCSCNMVMNQLHPVKWNNRSDRFPIPLSSAVDTKQLFLTTNQSVKVVNGTFESFSGVQVTNSSDILPLLPDFNKGTQLITTSMRVSIRLISPGLILDLIPESMFAGCYLVHFNTLSSWALVIAETSSTGSVKMNSGPLPSAIIWNIVSGTQYSWANVSGRSPSIIWHPDSKIAVYMIESLESENIYGSPAIIISDEPDSNGCMAIPGIFYLGNDEMNWSMGREYCMGKTHDFARILRKQNQDRLAVNISLSGPTDGWISLRRDLFTRQWYWRNEDMVPPNVNITYWGEGQPEVPERGLCASVSLDPAKNFTWKSARCCSKMKPICYKKPIYLTSLTQT